MDTEKSTSKASGRQSAVDTVVIEQTDKYWDCDCEQEYIHSTEIDMCVYCDAVQEEQPNSIVNEVIAKGLPL